MLVSLVSVYLLSPDVCVLFPETLLSVGTKLGVVGNAGDGVGRIEEGGRGAGSIGSVENTFKPRSVMQRMCFCQMNAMSRVGTISRRHKATLWRLDVMFSKKRIIYLKKIIINKIIFKNFRMLLLGLPLVI